MLGGWLGGWGWGWGWGWSMSLAGLGPGLGRRLVVLRFLRLPAPLGMRLELLALRDGWCAARGCAARGLLGDLLHVLLRVGCCTKELPSSVQGLSAVSGPYADAVDYDECGALEACLHSVGGVL